MVGGYFYLKPHKLPSWTLEERKLGLEFIEFKCSNSRKDLF
jgi:hypothetical protein